MKYEFISHLLQLDRTKTTEDVWAISIPFYRAHRVLSEYDNSSDPQNLNFIGLNCAKRVGQIELLWDRTTRHYRYTELEGCLLSKSHSK